MAGSQTSNPTPAVRLCATDLAARVAHGVPNGRNGWNFIEISDLALLVNPRRGRLTAGQRRRIGDFTARLQSIVDAAPSVQGLDRPMLPCDGCRAQIEEFHLAGGPIVFIGSPLAAQLIPLIAADRGRLDLGQKEHAARLLKGLVGVVRDMVDRTIAVGERSRSHGHGDSGDCNPRVGDG